MPDGCLCPCPPTATDPAQMAGGLPEEHVQAAAEGGEVIEAPVRPLPPAPPKKERVFSLAKERKGDVERRFSCPDPQAPPCAPQAAEVEHVEASSKPARGGRKKQLMEGPPQQ